MAKDSWTVDISQTLQYPFKDVDWLKKMVIASLLIFLSFIPVFPAVLLLGYLGEIIRRITVDKNAPSLPDWDDFSGYFSSGFRLFGVMAVYLIPSTLLIVIGYICIIIPALLTDTGTFAGGDFFGLFIAGYLVGSGLMGIGILLSMATGIITPIAFTHVIVKGDFSAAFKFKEIWDIFKANWGGFFVSFLILFGGSMILYYGSYFLVITVVLCCLYPFVLCAVFAYLGFVGAALFGEAYRSAVVSLSPADSSPLL
jgi:hypothetical protein